MFIRRVVGDSMVPSLEDGDFVVCIKRRTYDVGSIIVVTVDGKDLIKRIHGKTEDRVYVLGDNLGASTDSRQFGPVSKTLIRGKCSYLYRRSLTIKKL